MSHHKIDEHACLPQPEIADWAIWHRPDSAPPPSTQKNEPAALDQSGRSSGRAERLSLNETWSFHEPVRHRNDETALSNPAGSGKIGKPHVECPVVPLHPCRLTGEMHNERFSNERSPGDTRNAPDPTVD